MSDLVCISETDMCGVDGIQFLTGCTFGKGNLLHRDYGKMAFSFYDRMTGKGFRAVFNSSVNKDVQSELRRIMKRVAADSGNVEDKNKREQLKSKLQNLYISANLEDLFVVQPIETAPPKTARIIDSLCCDSCNEMTMESRTRRFDGKTYCIPCFRAVDQKM